MWKILYKPFTEMPLLAAFDLVYIGLGIKSYMTGDTFGWILFGGLALLIMAMQMFTWQFFRQIEEEERREADALQDALIRERALARDIRAQMHQNVIGRVPVVRFGYDPVGGPYTPPLPPTASPAKANARADSLLAEHLTDDQWADYKELGMFAFYGSDGNPYVITKDQRSYNVWDVNANRTRCAYPVEWGVDGRVTEYLPWGDTILGQMLMIKSDVEAFKRVANPADIGPTPWYKAASLRYLPQKIPVPIVSIRIPRLDEQPHG